MKWKHFLKMQFTKLTWEEIKNLNSSIFVKINLIYYQKTSHEENVQMISLVKTINNLRNKYYHITKNLSENTDDGNTFYLIL